MALLAPSVLSADFARLGEEAAAAARGGARMLHVDVMDGHFVPNLTLGPDVTRCLRQATDLFLDCHLMVSRPDDFIAPFAAAGASAISVHVEASTHLHRSVQLMRDAGVRAGVVLNPATPIHVLDDILPDLDYVLLMSVNPGFAGQTFIPGVLDKVRTLAGRIAQRGLATIIEVDGGVTEANARALAEAGAGMLVAGSAVFGGGQAEDAARRLVRLMDGVGAEPSWVP